MSKSGYSILGMLSLRPMSGYDIKKAMQQSTSYFWQESYGRIYPVLKQLLGEGLVTKRMEAQEGKPDRHVYTLTKKGHQAFLEWLGELAEPETIRNEVLLKLFFGSKLPAQNSVRQVEHWRRLMSGRLAELQAVDQLLDTCCESPQDLPYWRITVNYGKHLYEAVVQWCDESLAELQKLAEN